MARSDDTIKFTIAAEETVVNDTVKIVAQISGMVTPDLTESKLKESIREMMGRFIAAKWQFANIQRTAHDSGYEAINLVASARVPEAENRALETRSREVSQKGLSISRVTPDISFPASLVEETEQNLRLEIIRKALRECQTISTAMERAYRIAKIDYNMEEVPVYSNSRMSASMASAKTSYGSGFGGDAAGAGADDTLGNAQKFTMVAKVTLATSATPETT